MPKTASRPKSRKPRTPSPRPVQVLLVDDHPVIRAGVRGCLEQEAGFQVVGEAGDGVEAVRLVRRLRPDVVMLDVVMPGLDGFAVLEKLRWTLGGTRVLMFSAHTTIDHILKAMRLGASGYLSKNSPAEHYAPAIREVMAGRVYCSGDAMMLEHVGKMRMQPTRHPSGLDIKEIECLVWITEGMTLEAVALSMKLTLNQVRTLKAGICGKVGFSDPARLTRFAAAMGFIDIHQ